MKGVIHGVKLSQVSIILIGLVCVTVLVLTCTKTTFLDSLTPAQSPLLQLNPVQTDELSLGNVLEGNSSGLKTNGEDIESFGSSGIEHSIKEGSVENSPPTEEGLGKEKINSLSSTGVELAVDGENIEKLTISKEGREKEKVETAGSTGTELAINSENIEKLRSGKEGTAPAAETTGSEELSEGKNKTKQVKKAPDSAIKEESPVQIKQSSNSSSVKGCNYAKGKWVFDDDLPLYSGFGCKQWLSAMWACRLTQRTDFEYEKLRWQPKDCKVEKFTGAYFLEKMRDKTLAFVGDSLGRQQFQSLMCMATGGEERPDVLDVGHEYGLVKARGAIRPDGWAYRFPSTNTTVLYYWSASLCDLEPIDPSNPATDVAMHLDRPTSFLTRFIQRFDVLVLNTGHHWNRGKIQANKWVMYVNGAPNKDRRIADNSGARNLTVHSVVKWVGSQLPLYPRLKAFYRSISPRHFFNGDWNTGGTCDNTTPLSGGKEVEKDESSDLLAEAAVRGTGVGLLDVTSLSELRDEGHISRYSIKGTPGVQDCLHWCLPGVPDTWNEILIARI